MPKDAGKIIGLILCSYESQGKSISQRQGLAALDEFEFFLGHGGLFDVWRGADVDAFGYIFVAQVSVEGGDAHLAKPLRLLRLLLPQTAEACAPFGDETLAALAEHIDKVELPVTVFVVGDVLPEVEQGGEDGEFRAVFGDEELGNIFHGRVVDRLVKTDEGEDAVDVVFH